MPARFKGLHRCSSNRKTAGDIQHCTTGSGRIDVCLRKQGGQQIMPLIQVFVVLIVVGVLLWLVNRFMPMAGSIKTILNVVVVIVVVVWLVNAFGLMHYITSMHVGHMR
jgi:hypothetical protein